MPTKPADSSRSARHRPTWPATPQEIADTFDVTPRTVRDWRAAGLRPLVEGARPRYDVGEVARWLLERERATGRRELTESEARIRKLTLEGDLAEVKLAELRGELSPTAEATATIDRILGAVRTEVLGLRARYLERVLGHTDRAALAAVLDDCANDLLRAMADGVATIEPVGGDDEEAAA